MTDGEFGTLAEAAAEIGRGGAPLPAIARVAVPVGDGRRVSTLKWGDGRPEIVFLHGGGQNAHTWDLVALALRRPALAVDLPGHGHSDWRADRDYRPWRNADAVGVVLDELVGGPVVVVGMSLGGLTGIRLASTRPDAVRALVVVDVTPEVHRRSAAMTQRQRGTTALIGGPSRFDTLEQMVELAIRAAPHRPASAVRRGAVHNSRLLPDGRWAWRYDSIGRREDHPLDFTPLWDDVTHLRVPTMLVRGGESAFVAYADAEEFVRRHPATRVEVVPDAGHSVQSDQPLNLARLIGSIEFD